MYILENGTPVPLEETYSIIPKSQDDTVFDEFAQLNVDENVDKKYQELEKVIDELTNENDNLKLKLRKAERELKDEREFIQYKYAEIRKDCRRIRGQIRNGEANTAVSIAEEWCGDVPSDYTSDEDD